MAPSQTSPQFPPYCSPCHDLKDGQLVAGMGSLSVSGQPQGQSTTPISSPHSGHALQQIQQQPQNNYAPQHYGQPYGSQVQGQVQNCVTTPQPIQQSNCVPAPVPQSTSFYPIQSEIGYNRQQPVGYVSSTVDQAKTGNAAGPPYTSHAQNHYPGYGGPVASLQKQNAPSSQSPLVSTVSNSVLNTPATTVNSMASPSSNNIPSAFQPNQIQYAHQPQQSLVTPQPISAVQPYQPHSTMSQPSELNYAHPSQNTVLYHTSAGQLSSQNSMHSQQALVPSQYQPSQAVQTAYQQQLSNRPHAVQAGVQHQNSQQIQTQNQTQALMSDTQHQNIQNTVPSETVQRTQHTIQIRSQTQGHAPVHQYQQEQVPTQMNRQPIQQQVQPQGQQRTQYQTQPQHVHQQYQNQQPTQHYYQPQALPQYQPHQPHQPRPLPTTQFMPPNAAQQQYNSQLPQSSQPQYPAKPPQQVYQPQIANAQFMPSSYKPSHIPNHPQPGTAPNKLAPKFASDPMAATTSFLGKSYKSTTKFLGTKKGIKYAAGGAGVLLAGFLGAEMIDGLGDSGDAFTDSGSGGFDTGGGYDVSGGSYDASGGGYDASGGGYETGASGGVDAGSSYAQTDVQGMADANSLAMQQALEQQGQMNAQALIGNDVVVQGGQSFSMAAGNSYGLI